MPFGDLARLPAPRASVTSVGREFAARPLDRGAALDIQAQPGASFVGQFLDPRRGLFDTEVVMIALIGNVVVAVVALGLFTATLRLSK